VRPEFQAFLDNEQKTLDLVRDVADTLDNIAANPLHTPALYSGFLRALISAKLDQQQLPSSHHSINGDDKTISVDDVEQQQQQQQQQLSADGSTSSQGGGDANAYSHGNSLHLFGEGGNNGNNSFMLNGFQFESEMGPVADISTFPPTMAPHPSEDSLGSLTMENILSSGFWDSMLVPGAFGFYFFGFGFGLFMLTSHSFFFNDVGYNSMDGLSGGFVFGANGSGLITPRFGGSPIQSGANTPGQMSGGALTQMSINAAFDNSRKEGGIKIDS